MRPRLVPAVVLAVLLPLAGCASAPAHRARTSGTRSALSSRRTRTAPASAGSSGGSSGGSSAGSSAAPGTPTASPDVGASPGYPTVGALFAGGADGTHYCTASVVASTTGDTVITAAHCIHGSGVGTVFVPGYRRGDAPAGVWHVTAAYVSPSWRDHRDPHADYVVLTVASQRVHGVRRSLAAVTGSERLGGAPGAGSMVTLVGYDRGRDDLPVHCRVPVYVDAGFATVDCHGFSDGSSGSPWLTADGSGSLVARGVIGGPAGGGCHEYTSTTSSFTDDVAVLVRRAEQDAPADTVPAAPPDGC